MQKYGKAGQATDVNILQRMRMGCRVTRVTDTLRMSMTYCFSIATMDLRSRLIITFVLTLPILLRKSISSFRKRGGEMALHVCYFEPELFYSRTERSLLSFASEIFCIFTDLVALQRKTDKKLLNFIYDGPRYLISSQGCC